VDVHVQGVSFEKENNALSAGAKNAVLESGAEANAEIEPAEAEAPVEQPAPVAEAAPAAQEAAQDEEAMMMQ